MTNFNERKREYLEKLRANPLLVQGIMNKKDTNSPEVMRMVFDPKTENELTVAISLTTVLGDALEMVNSYYDNEIEDYNSEDIYNLFKRVILALKNDNHEELALINEELTKLATPEELGKLSYGVIKVFAINAFDAFETLAVDCGFDLSDDISEYQFQVYFNQANAKINEMLPQIDFKDKLDINNEKLIEFLKRYASSFHEEYQREYENNKKNNF